jgi:hypothetical protein
MEQPDNATYDFFATTQEGRTHEVRLDTGGGDPIAQAACQMLAKGATRDELDGMILTLEPPAPVVLGAELETLPPPPHSETVLSDLPQRSESVLISAHEAPLFVHWSFDKKHWAWGPVSGRYVDLRPRFPRGAQLAFRKYWYQVGSEILTGPVSHSESYTLTYTHGMTNSQTLGGELGVSYKGLSGKLSATTTRSVTVSEQTSKEKTFATNVNAGDIAVFTIWQLVEEFALVDADHNPITWHGTYRSPATFLPAYANVPEHTFANHPERFYQDLVTFDSEGRPRSTHAAGAPGDLDTAEGILLGG